MRSAEKLLIVGPSWVGDMVMAQSLYRLLARRGASRIDVLAPPWSMDVLARMPEVTRAVELDVGHGELGWRTRRSVAMQLAAERYDRAIILPRSLKAALVPWLAGIPVRTGFRGEWRYGLINDMRPFDASRLDMTVSRFVALGLTAEESELPALEPPSLRSDASATARLVDRLGLALDRKIVAVMPGAEYGAAKRWPAERFAQLSAKLADAGFGVWVLGSAKERSIGDAIAASAGTAGVANLCGETSLEEVIDLASAAAVAVTNDSGLMHIAAAVGTHVVAIYGSSTPSFTPPLTERKTVLYRALSCSPCFERDCPLGHLDCLRGIHVEQVLAATLAAARDGAGRESAATS